MKNYSSRTKGNSPRNFKKSTAFKALITVLFALMVLLLFRDILGGVSSAVTTPVYGVRNWFLESSATIPSYFRDRSLLVDRIHELERELVRLTARDAVLTKTTDENERLRSLLGMESAERIGAGVVARPPYVPYDALVIDQGARDGILKGAVVYHGEDQAIGFISQAYEKSALVTLFTSSGIETTVYILGPDIYTNAFGEGGGVLRVSVPQGIPLAAGDTVVLPSLEAGLLGTVRTVESVSTKPEQNGFVTFETPMQSLQFVSVSRSVPDTVSFEEAQEIVRNVRTQFLNVDVPDEIIVETSTSTATSTSSGDAPATEEVHEPINEE